MSGSRYVSTRLQSVADSLPGIAQVCALESLRAVAPGTQCGSRHTWRPRAHRVVWGHHRVSDPLVHSVPLARSASLQALVAVTLQTRCPGLSPALPSCAAPRNCCGLVASVAPGTGSGHVANSLRRSTSGTPFMRRSRHSLRSRCGHATSVAPGTRCDPVADFLSPRPAFAVQVFAPSSVAWTIHTWKYRV